MVRVFANGPEDLGSIPWRVIPKTHKMALDADLLNTQQEGQRRRKEGRKKEDTRTLLYKYIYLSLYCKGSKGLFKVCMWKGAGDRT